MHKSLNFRHFQIIGWGLFLLLFSMYTTNIWEYPVCGFISAMVSTAVYAALVYLQGLWLFPRFFQQGKMMQYAFWSLIVLAASIMLRMAVNYSLRELLDNYFYNWTSRHFAFVLLTNTIAFVFGALARIAYDYLLLLQNQAKMRAQQIAAELNLLKSQVQPHFLFNTLNNIYYLAHSKSELTTVAIDRLAQIMRYLTEQAPKERVPLNEEIAFLQHYISLELLRFPNPPQLKTDFLSGDTPVPPMLLMPFVENLFKHGIDKTVSCAKAEICLTRHNGTLQFCVRNPWSEPCQTRGGTGLNNLNKRLDLLYNQHYTLRTGRASDGWYEAFLEIPVH